MNVYAVYMLNSSQRAIVLDRWFTPHTKIATFGSPAISQNTVV